MTDTAAPWAVLGLPPVVNAAGKMTYLGSSAVSATVAADLAAGAQQYVDMSDLKQAAGRRVAELTDAPAACVVSCAAAGIVQGIAATITGTDLALVEQVPFIESVRRDVLIQKSHAVHFGAPLAQMIRLGGGRPIELGSANRASSYHLEAALNERTTAVLHVVTHHARAESTIGLADVVRLAHERGVPVVVDAAAEVDLRRYVAEGADLVIYSGHKAIGGPTSGVVLGRADLVAATMAQEHGAGRAMKVGKESIAGILRALDEYVSRAGPTTDELQARLHEVIASAGEGLSATFETIWDASRPIPRLRVELSQTAPVTASELVTLLERSTPSIRTRNHDVDRGVVVIDPRELNAPGARAIGAALRAILITEAVSSP